MIPHTPGPWKAYCRDVGHEDGTPWPEDKFLQWEVGGPRVPDGRGEYYEADARLIAAAPDLLAVLESMKQKLRIDDPLDMYDDVCEAIAKATGEKP